MKRLKNNTIIQHAVLYIYLAVLSIGILVYNDASDVEYAFTIIICILLLTLNHWKIKVRTTKPYKMCFVMAVIYLYGLIIGLIRGNSLGLVARDHAGMVLYLFIVVVGVFSNEYKKIAKIIIYVGITALVVQILYSIALCQAPSLYWKLPMSNLINRQSNMVMISGKNIIIILASLSLFCIFQGKRIVLSLVTLVIVGVTEMFMPTDASKISLFFSIGCVMLAFWGSKKNNNKLIVTIVSILLSILLLSFLMPKVLVIFSSKDIGNSIRMRQIDYVINNFSFLGYGHGTSYAAIDRGYMIEVAWLDIIYKYGFCSLALVWVYFDTVRCIIRCIRKAFCEGVKDYYIAILPGLMSYLMGGLSNPILFSPLHVMCHIFSMIIAEGYIDKYTDVEKSSERNVAKSITNGLVLFENENN